MLNTMPATTLKRPAQLAEQRRTLVADALRARRHVLKTGKAYAFEDVKAYYTAIAARKPAKRPRLRRWRA